MNHATSSNWARAAGLLLVLNAILLLRPLAPGQATAPATPAAPVEVDAFGAAEVEQIVPSPAPAIHMSMWWNEEVAVRDLELVDGMPGFRWVKQKFAWRDIEGLAKSSYDWFRTDRIVQQAEQQGLYLLVRIDRPPFWAQADGGATPLENAPPADLQDMEDICYAIAARYKGRIHAYQVWNEPNLAREWGEQPPDPAAYVRLLERCYVGIKAGDPDALVISAGLAPTGTGFPVAMPDDEYLQAMYDAGGAQFFDMLGLNAPGYAAPPQTDPAVTVSNPEYGGFRWNAFRHVEDMRRIMVANGDAHKQVAILEMGWTTDRINPDYKWFAVSPQEQAEYLAGAYWYARQHWQPWAGIMTTIYIPDPYWDSSREEYWWGITFPGWPEPIYRPAYFALKGLPDWSGRFYDDSEYWQRRAITR
ncbi:MAG: hypothetical protein IT326_00105 [Anaerolineae bacterium]|nr:hypothetical protein [Anaerolineae bacterium]